MTWKRQLIGFAIVIVIALAVAWYGNINLNPMGGVGFETISGSITSTGVSVGGDGTTQVVATSTRPGRAREWLTIANVCGKPVYLNFGPRPAKSGKGYLLEASSTPYNMRADNLPHTGAITAVSSTTCQLAVTVY